MSSSGYVARVLGIAVGTLLVAGCAGMDSAEGVPSGAASTDVPEFQVDPFWPKPLPENWILGQVAGLTITRTTTSGSSTARAPWSP